jgi:hypothetical protein
MSIANLTRYKFKYGGDDYCGCDVLDSKDFEFEGGYVKFEEAIEASSNSLQQLKAEIAALNASIKLSSGDLFINKINVSERLRQLSAV